MNEQLLQEKALEEAVFSIISWNECELSAAEILKAWQVGEEPAGVTICETYEDLDPDYLAEECESKANQFARFAREILEEASK